MRRQWRHASREPSLRKQKGHFRDGSVARLGILTYTPVSTRLARLWTTDRLSSCEKPAPVNPKRRSLKVHGERKDTPFFSLSLDVAAERRQSSFRGRVRARMTSSRLCRTQRYAHSPSQ